MTSNIDNTEYIKCSRCHMKFINDDEHIKTDFGYNRLNIRYKQCVRCRTTSREHAKKYYEANKDKLINKAMEYNKVYQSENVECNVCGKTITRKTMFKHRDSPSCKAIANVCKYYTEIWGEKHKDDIYSLGKTKLKEIMHGEFDGGIKFNDEEKNGTLKFYEKPFWGAVKRYNELNNITNDELANSAIKYHNID